MKKKIVIATTAVVSVILAGLYFIDASKKYELESIAFTDEPVISLQQVINCTEVKADTEKTTEK